MRIILCPFHHDTNPSMRIYGKFSHCFSCGAHVLTDELDLPEHSRAVTKKEPTSIPSMMKYIDSLPRQAARGFMLPHDTRGFYIQWPDKTYYKRRNYEGKSRYTAPSGVKPPLFVYKGSTKHLVVVEGELNAMSLHQVVYGDYTIASPGPASDFMRHIRWYQHFKQVTLVLDYDASGVVFGCQLKDALLKLGKHVKLICVPKDYNQILQDDGEEAVREVFEREIK